MSRSLLAVLLTSLFFAACSTNNVTVDNSLQKYFDSAGVAGAFGLLDNGQGHFIIYDLPRYRDSAYSPGRTFDILQALVGLQTGILKDDISLRGPFQDTQASGYFVGLAAQLGRDTLKKWIDSLHYGNGDMGGPADSFWLNGRMKITPDEQLGLIKKLYFDQLPFFNRPHKLVRNIMPVESNSNYRLVYKTSQGIGQDHHRIGWVLGWEEENKHPYFFVLNLESADTTKDLGPIGLHIVKSILRPMGFFEGKK